jgi:hypothetical protein
MLPVQAVDAFSKPAPPPAADGHARPAAARAHGVHRGHARHGRSDNISRNSEGGRPNDIQVTADDGGAPQEHASGAHGTKARPSRAGNAAGRPGTGADAGWSSDADDPALPPEAQEALKEAADLQHSGQGQQQGQQGQQPAQGTPQAPQQGGPAGAPPNVGAPRATTPRQPITPRRPGQVATDQSTNQTSNRRTAKMPVAFFNADPALSTNPSARSSRLVLHYNAGGVSPERTVTLQCYPSGGTHPKAAEACSDVAKASGDLEQMPAQRNARACFMIYAPVTVSAQGEWSGQPVRFQEKYPNTCVMRDKTGSVFDF